MGGLASVAAETKTIETTGQFVVTLVSTVLLFALLVLDLKYLRQSRRIAKELNLPKGQWLRVLAYLPFDPIIEVAVVGVVLGQDLVQNWEHVVVGVIGAVLGVVAGHFRYRIQYVRAVPERKAIIFVRSRTEYVALGILVVVRIVAEQHQIPVVGPLTLLITGLLSLIVFESIGRTWFSYRRYLADVAAGASGP